jgi:hypothetical protein
MLTKPIIVALSLALLALAMLWAVQTAPPLFTNGHLMSPQFTSQSAASSAEERQLQAEVDQYLAGLSVETVNEETGPMP